MTRSVAIPVGHYSHDALLHSNDEELVRGTQLFVAQGLASGGSVLVHGTKDRVEMLRAVLGSHPRLEYGLDEDLYLSPSSTLFAYQHKLAESPEPLELWATGTVPLGDRSGHAAWGRYESLVNEVLGPYAFHGLCTYDTETLPATTLAAAKATHQHIGAGDERCTSAEYKHPADFLDDPLAAVPDAPETRPAVVMTLDDAEDLKSARWVVRRSALSSSAVSRDAIDGFLTAVNEVLVNGLQHAGTPVQLSLWVSPARLVCRVTDAGPGMADPLTGYRYPEPTGPKGLWVARQLCDDLFVRSSPDRGSSVLLVTA